MFFVGETREERNTKLAQVKALDLGMAVVVAAADFEWSIRRSILALGCQPTKDLKAGLLTKLSGHEKYKEAWREEVYPHTGNTLVEAVGMQAWHQIASAEGAFSQRHRLVHGIRTVSESKGEEAYAAFLAGSNALFEYAEHHNTSIFNRRIDRRKPRVV